VIPNTLVLVRRFDQHLAANQFHPGDTPLLPLRDLSVPRGDVP
jgi:hypothetical protein